MKNLLIRYFFLLFIVLTLNACTSENSEVSLINGKIEDISLKIIKLENEIVVLKDEINLLKDINNKLEIVNPIEYENNYLYINILMPLVISLPISNDIPILIYKMDATLFLYFENDETSQYIEGYTLVPTLLVKDQPDSAEYYYSKDIVKTINNDWVIVKVKSIETSLDEETNKKISKILDIIKFY